MRLPVPPLRHNKKWFNIHIRRSGRNRARTCDPLLVRQVLSQLSYAPWDINILKLMTTQKGLEPSTSAVTGRRSNQLSHWAIIYHYFSFFTFPSMLRWSGHVRFASLLELSHWAIICHYYILSYSQCATLVRSCALCFTPRTEPLGHNLSLYHISLFPL